LRLPESGVSRDSTSREARAKNVAGAPGHIYTKRNLVSRFCRLATLLAALVVVFTSVAVAEETPSFWATKGFYKAEDHALNAVIADQTDACGPTAGAAKS